MKKTILDELLHVPRAAVMKQKTKKWNNVKGII